MTGKDGVPKPQPPRDHGFLLSPHLCELSTGLALATPAMAAVRVDSHPAGWRQTARGFPHLPSTPCHEGPRGLCLHRTQGCDPEQ